MSLIYAFDPKANMEIMCIWKFPHVKIKILSQPISECEIRELFIISFFTLVL
jgi:hypothetical protein